MTITNWPLSERPREKLLLNGSKSLSDSELLAIFINSGIRGKTAIDIARELIVEFGSLKRLIQANPHELYQKPGLGKAKYALLKAAVEFGQRCHNDALLAGERLNDSELTKEFLATQLKNYPHEVFSGLFLDSQNRLICYEELFHGTLAEANVYPREVVKRGLAHNAAKIIFAHNHPSGNATPSQADRDITVILQRALALVDIIVIDHIVIGHRESISFAEIGLI